MTLQLDGKLVLIGAGKMGGALLLGMIDHGLDPANVIVQDPSPPADVKSALAKLNITAQADPAPGDKPPSVIILAVKPQLVANVLPGVAKNLIGPDTLVISVAAGLTIDSLENHLPPSTALIRAMPNTPAMIGQGMTVCCPNTRTTSTQRDLCEKLLATVGATAWITSESHMDAVTAVSGSGPAYIFHLAECLTEAGTLAGLDKDLSTQLAIQTIAGAGALLIASNEDAATLRKNVTSPGGTTAAALDILMTEKGGLKSLIENAVKAASKRSSELAG